MAAPELNNKVNVSIALIVSLVLSAFTLGGIVTGILGLDSKITDEIRGLRDDMEKEDNLIREEIERVRTAGETRQDWMNARMDRKVKNHEAIYHNRK